MTSVNISRVWAFCWAGTDPAPSPRAAFGGTGTSSRSLFSAWLRAEGGADSLAAARLVYGL